MKRVLLCGALVVSGGCGRNAFFELEIDMPPATGRYAIISIASGNRDFNGTWAGDGTLPGIELAKDQPTVKAVSVEGSSDNFDNPVEVKIVFCTSAACNASGDDFAPEAHLVVDRAFYEGKRTSYTWKISCLPKVDAMCGTAPVETHAGKCDVSGCRAGTSSNYCVGDKHFCEM